MPEETPYKQQDDEITLKELLLIIKEYALEVKHRWKIILVIFIPVCIFMLFQAFTTPATYIAKLTFMVNEDEGRTAGVGSILGQFGLGGMTTGQYNLDKILELSKSRKILQSTILNKTTWQDSTDYIANHLIKNYALDKKWGKNNTEMIDFRFSHDSIKLFNAYERSALKGVYGLLRGNEKKKGLVQSNYNESTGIMTLQGELTDQALSIQLINNLYETLGSFYVDKETEKQKETYEIVKLKVDSIAMALSSAEYAYANFKDSNRDLWLNKDMVREMRYQNDISKLNLMHGEALKNLEIADFSLRINTPFIQEIDRPFPPIKPKKKSKIITLIKAGLLSFFLGITYIIGSKIVRDALKE